jgi:hypothetical protein
MAVSEKQKKYMLIGGAGLILLYLLWRYYQGNQASNTASTTGTAAPTTASDYASLAGQEQADVAGLQSGIAGLQSQEQSDVGGLQTGIAGLTGQETSDVSGLTSTVAGLTGQLQNMADLQSSMQDQIAGIAIGTQPVSPAAISTHKGGPFYNYYVKVTGRPPPASVQTSNFLYQAWKTGVKATALQAKPSPHPSSRNTHIAHPNGNHQQKAGTQHPNASSSRTAPAPKPKPPPAKPPAPKPKPPKPKTKAKASGPRK